MDKELGIQTEEIQHDGKDTFHFHRYEPTPYDVLERLFHSFILKRNDKLVDYGCGLGRLNFYLEHRFSLKSTGVEMVATYYQRALKNQSTYKGNKDNISFVCAKAEDYIVSADENIFYFFNPFSVEIFRKVINRILDSVDAVPREVTVILYYPEDDTIFYLESHTLFRLQDEIAANDDIRTDHRERFCIYKLPL